MYICILIHHAGRLNTPPVAKQLALICLGVASANGVIETNGPDKVDIVDFIAAELSDFDRIIPQIVRDGDNLSIRVRDGIEIMKIEPINK